MQLLPKIDHRYVIKTYTTFWGNDQIYTVMDLADGQHHPTLQPLRSTAPPLYTPPLYSPG